MSREPMLPRKTAIAYKTEEKTVLRGYNLSDLAEELLRAVDGRDAV